LTVVASLNERISILENEVATGARRLSEASGRIATLEDELRLADAEAERLREECHALREERDRLTGTFDDLRELVEDAEGGTDTPGTKAPWQEAEVDPERLSFEKSWEPPAGVGGEPNRFGAKATSPLFTPTDLMAPPLEPGDPGFGSSPDETGGVEVSESDKQVFHLVNVTLELRNEIASLTTQRDAWKLEAEQLRARVEKNGTGSETQGVMNRITEPSSGPDMLYAEALSGLTDEADAENAVLALEASLAEAQAEIARLRARLGETDETGPPGAVRL
jgi:regulator of replication initiation timing